MEPKGTVKLEDLTPAALVLKWLTGFFEQQHNFDTLHMLLHKPLGRAQGIPSLRVLEHLVTSFSKQKGFDFKLPHADIPMHLYDAYQAELLRHGKVLFDVFAREDKQDSSKHVLESPDGDGRTIHTTAKQMNFVRWAIVNDVVDYAIQNLQKIRDHLPSHARGREAALEQQGPKKKRQRTAYSRPPQMYTGDFKLSFNLPKPTAGSSKASASGQVPGPDASLL